MRTAIPVLSTLALMLAACSDTPPTANKADIEKSLRNVEFEMVKNAAAKDAAAFSSHYTTDAIFMSPGEAPLKGREAIHNSMTTMFADPNLKLDFASDRVEIASSGDLAATRGTYTLTATNPATRKPMSDKGSYVTVFRKQADGTWLAALDINTSEMPPPAPPTTRPPAARKGRRR